MRPPSRLDGPPDAFRHEAPTRHLRARAAPETLLIAGRPLDQKRNRLVSSRFAAGDFPTARLRKGRKAMDRTRVVIMGAAGRDFHDFNTVYRSDPSVEVVAFTAATQIPGIAGRSYPPRLAGALYPEGIPIVAEAD